MGVYGQNSLDYPFSCVPFSFSSVDPIFSNHQNNPRQIPYFSYFTCVENQPLKKRLKQKRHIIFKNLQNVLSFAKLYEHLLFLFIKIHN